MKKARRPRSNAALSSLWEQPPLDVGFRLPKRATVMAISLIAHDHVSPAWALERKATVTADNKGGVSPRAADRRITPYPPGSLTSRRPLRPRTRRARTPENPLWMRLEITGRGDQHTNRDHQHAAELDNDVATENFHLQSELAPQTGNIGFQFGSEIAKVGPDPGNIGLGRQL